MDDQTLLARFAETRDAKAFEELTRRHAGMVRAVCFRVLCNAHDAEEVTQECFLELARHADCVRSSVVGWLHRAATSRSLNLLRSKSRRRVRERAVGTEANASQISSDVSTRELHQVINGAMTELPEDLRLPVKLHYFEGQSQRDVAKSLGVNQSTISRRMQEALLFLRDRLTRAGFATTSPAVVFLLQNPKVFAAENSGMVDVAVIDSTLKSVGAGSAIYGWFKSVVIAAVPVLICLVLGGWVSFAIAIGLTMYVARYRPNWWAELCSSIGFPNIYLEQTLSLSKWTWTTPPDGWRGQVMMSLASSVFFGSLAVLFAVGTTQPQMGTAALGFTVATWCAIHAFRIICRVYFVCASQKRSDSTLNMGKPVPSSDLRNTSLNLLDVVQLLVIGIAGVGFAVQSIVDRQSSFVWPAILLVGSVGFGMAIRGVWLFCRLTKLNELNLQVIRNVIAGFAGNLIRTRGFAFTMSAGSISRCFDASVAQNVQEDLNPESDPVNVRNQLIETATRHWTGTHSILIICSSIVCALSAIVMWNPAAVKGMSLSLAAIQTSMLGWFVYRLAAFRRYEDPGVVRFATIVIVVACFVLNSGVCFANWLG